MLITKSKILLFIFIAALSIQDAYAASVYVDGNGTNTEEDGSEEKPYHSISSALAKAGSSSENDRQITVKFGNYKERIVLPDNTTLKGSDKEKVIIDQENKEGATVSMGRDSTLENLTVRGGNYGVIVPPYGKNIIRDCLVEKSKRIGIWIKRSNKLLKNGVEIWGSTVSNNYRKGLYGESRFIYFINNIFENNGEEGIDLRSKVGGTISGNTISNNGEGGIEAEIRNVSIEISGNTLTQNKSNGVTLNNRNQTGGKIIIKDNVISSNLHYGIRCAGTKTWSKKLWRKSIKTSKNIFAGNLRKDIATSCHSK